MANIVDSPLNVGLEAGTNNIGDVDVLTVPAAVAPLAAAVGVTIDGRPMLYISSNCANLIREIKPIGVANV